MIHYRQDPWLGFCILLQPHGSVLLCSVPRALIAGLLTWALMTYGPPASSGGADIMWSPTLFNFFLSLAVLVLAFHTNQAYQRFWEARSQVQIMASWWADAASSFVALDEMTGIAKGEFAWGADWRGKILHLLSLLHAVSIQYLLHNDAEKTQLEVLGGMDTFEAKLLSLTDDQTFLVMHWVVQEMMKRLVLEPKGLGVPPPCFARIQQQLSNGMLAFNSACKIEDTPFPFPYVQLVQLMDWFMTVACPVVIASWMISMPCAIVLSVIAVGAFHATFAAACAMESPFGRQANDLPLVELHRDFVNRLKSIVDTHVAARLNNMIVKVDARETQEYDMYEEERPDSPLAKIRFKLNYRTGGSRLGARAPQHPPHTHMKGKAAHLHRAGRGHKAEDPDLAPGPLSRFQRLPLYPKILRRGRRGTAPSHSTSHRHEALDDWAKDWDDTESDLSQRPVASEDHARASATSANGSLFSGVDMEPKPESLEGLRVCRGGAGSRAGSAVYLCPPGEPGASPGAEGTRSTAAAGLETDGDGEKDLFSIPYRSGDGDAGRLSVGPGSAPGMPGSTGGGQSERQSVETLCQLGTLSRGLSRRLDGRSSTRRQSFFKSVGDILRLGSRSGKDVSFESLQGPQKAELSSKGETPARASVRSSRIFQFGDDTFAAFHAFQRDGSEASRRHSEAEGVTVPASTVPINIHVAPASTPETPVGAGQSIRKGSDSGSVRAGASAREKGADVRGKVTPKGSGGQEDLRGRTVFVFDPATSPAAMMEEEAARELAAATEEPACPPVDDGSASDEARSRNDALVPGPVEATWTTKEDRIAHVETSLADSSLSRRATFISIEEPLPVSAVRRIGGTTHTLSPGELAAKVAKNFREKDVDKE
ncbi:hypothetical protein TGME49_319620 [Toxoplasma gondii ME49]|uniref:Bestrophin n=6 Tax=Toxoplasma gondii TaxID=5811 RepID=S7UK64_TOXGG|nr:hypothetical protein TGME49_319620 [Toxoplasma gondii ME49]EPR58140.1 hypothetical protein TGGT1_319620 [Toxoplasma gondii GT1]KAF4644934.1 hypothetical protein TGRH88_007490 [Toxoplasma gondii]KYF39102.1 bestrophin [Toxoplasma gondii ARI]PIL97451.1 bestrophin [Toxoplasma gondii COUG]EPT31512.1 hypothetical protein TGME49_319620 [Toxoplasma gondii ME49]|eukprot:XP_002369839.1 hypothetical protein TGME49_319620 [Toxoplasma gondii ME49]